MKHILALALIIAAFTVILPARAQEAIQCGTPTHTDINTTSNTEMCDIYTRQLGYYDEQKHLKEQLLERQKSFHAPRKAAYDTYIKEREAHWGKMGAAKTGGNP